MKILYLIRHGQSENNAFAAEAKADVAEEPPRTADPSLTSAGYEQAKCVADYLARETDKTDLRDGTAVEGGHGIQRLYTSAMLRALETTQPIATALGLKPEIWLDVHEEGGIWLDEGDGRGAVGRPGLTHEGIARQFPCFVQPDAITGNGWWNRLSNVARSWFRDPPGLRRMSGDAFRSGRTGSPSSATARSSACSFSSSYWANTFRKSGSATTTPASAAWTSTATR